MGRKSNHDISRPHAIFIAVLSLLMSVMFFGTFSVNTAVEKSETKNVVSSFEDYDYQTGRHHSINYIFLILDNGERISIAGVCVNEELHSTIKAMKKGTELQALISTDTNTVVELKANGNEILNFDYAQKMLRQEGVGFLYPAIFMLVIFSYSVYKAITTKERITKADIKFYWDIMKEK